VDHAHCHSHAADKACLPAVPVTPAML
jgi:hypothetical protein